MDLTDLVQPRGAMRAALAHSSLLHFLLLGALLFGLRIAAGTSGAQDRAVYVSTAEILRLEQEWTRASGRPPTEREAALLLQQHIDEKILLEQAFARGWNRTDPIVRQRLLRNLRFVDARPDATDEALLQEARDLGLDRSDLVVQRRLIDRMRRTLAAQVYAEEPGEELLESYLHENAERFRNPARVSLSHVFLSRDLRGERLAEDAEALLNRLREEAIQPEKVTALGDPFLIAAQLPLSTRTRLRAQLGPDFAEAAFVAPRAQWSGPADSAYGAHLLWIHDREESKPGALSDHRDRVRAAYLAEQERIVLGHAMKEMRARVEVQFESEEVPRSNEK